MKLLGLNTNQRYQFTGDPVAQALAAKTYQNDRQMEAQVANAQTQAGAQRHGNAMQFMSGLYSQPAQFANSTAAAYGNYAEGLGNVGTAIANERGHFYGANALAESARQNAASSIGAASLGAYGGATNNAMQAWASNQAAYQKSVADMQAANQNARSQYGMGRNQALVGLAAAGSLGGGGVPGSGFTATGTDGEIASGSYGGVPGGGGSLPAGFLDGLRRDIMAGDAGIGSEADAGRRQLDTAYYGNRNAPQDMLTQALSGLYALAGQGLGASAYGMDQFYDTQNDPRNRGEYGGILDGLSRGYGDALSGMRGCADMLRPIMGIVEREVGR
jgi:hypothetical protein